MKEVLIGGGRTTTKRQISWMCSPLVEYASVNTIGKHLRKKHNMIFCWGSPAQKLPSPMMTLLTSCRGWTRRQQNNHGNQIRKTRMLPSLMLMRTRFKRSWRLTSKQLLALLCPMRDNTVSGVSSSPLVAPDYRDGHLLMGPYSYNFPLRMSSIAMHSFWLHQKN